MTKERTITALAQTAKKSMRSAQVGEYVVCTRCQGKGFGSWHADFGKCWKCDGKGAYQKPAEIITIALYIVKDEESGYFHQLHTTDQPEVETTLWKGDVVEYRRHKSTETTIPCTIVAKMLQITNTKTKHQQIKKCKDFETLSLKIY